MNFDDAEEFSLRDAGGDGVDEQQEAENIKRPAIAAELLIVDRLHGEHEREADGYVHELALDVALSARIGERVGPDADQAQSAEDHNGSQDGPVGGDGELFPELIHTAAYSYSSA